MTRTVMTLEYAREQLWIWRDAMKAVSSGQAYTIGRRQLTRVNVTDILRMIRYWEDQVDALENGRRADAPRVMRGVPRDL